MTQSRGYRHHQVLACACRIEALEQRVLLDFKVPIFGTGCDGFTSEPIRYSNGQIKMDVTDLQSNGYGMPWAVTRSWNSVKAPAGYSFEQWNLGWGNPQDARWQLSAVPYLIRGSGTLLYQVVLSSTDIRSFKDTSQPPTEASFAAVVFSGDKFSKEGTEYLMVDAEGDRYRFHAFDGDNTARLKSYTDSFGHTTNFVYDTNRRLKEKWRETTVGADTIRESYVSVYMSDSTFPQLPNFRTLKTVTLQRQVNQQTAQPVRSVEYKYYEFDSNFDDDDDGLEGQLKYAIIRNDSGNAIDKEYYRYYLITDSSGGYAGGLRLVFHSDSLARLSAAYSNIDTVTDANARQYADNAFEYRGTTTTDSLSQGWVTKEIAQGAGCTCTGNGGRGTYVFTYDSDTESSYDEQEPINFNRAKYKTLVTLPNTNYQETVYANPVGQPIIKLFKEVSSGKEWRTYWRYDSLGRVILKANPSALKGPGVYSIGGRTQVNEISNTGDDYNIVWDNKGLVERFSYDSTSGFLASVSIQRGDGGTGGVTTLKLQQTFTYTSRSIVVSGNTYTTYPLASLTVFPTETNNPLASDGRTTSFTYGWYGDETPSDPNDDTMQMRWRKATLPAVSTTKNGPGTSDIYTTLWDRLGNEIWQQDGEGYLNYAGFDPITGAMTTQIRGVDLTQSGFSDTPTSAELGVVSKNGPHLKTVYDVDPVGRPKSITDPNGNVRHVVYLEAENDSNPDDLDAQEVRTYPAWQSGTPTSGTTTGPVHVDRRDRPRSYVESITYSAASLPATNYLPNGNEALTGVTLQSLTRSYLSESNQPIKVDRFHTFPGTYSPNTDWAYDAGQTNLYRTEFWYDHLGNLERTLAPTATITRVVHDGLNRVTSTWVGTDDTPISGFWSPTNTEGTDLAKVSENEYDSGDIGDGTLTKSTRYPTGSSNSRVTQMSYDWRNRAVAAKSGATTDPGTELQTVQRLLTYVEYDNLNQVTNFEQYDGDRATITADSDANGVPDKPTYPAPATTSSQLRAKTATEYDEHERPFVEHLFGVTYIEGGSPSATISPFSLDTKFWYDRRGMVIATSRPGAPAEKSVFDGAGRLTKSYAVDWSSPSWSTASSVNNDAVLTQTETQYDKNSNVTLTIRKGRFHNESTAGELNSASAAPLARVSYMSYWYDPANRLKATADVGTYGGTTYPRPTNAPLDSERSDTFLLTTYTYNNAGWQEFVKDSRAIQRRTDYDRLGRVVRTIENYDNGTPGNADDRITEYTYDGHDHVRTLKAVLPGSNQYQTTEYVYIKPSESSSSDIVSNDLLWKIKYPDKISGDASDATGHKEYFNLNALGERKTNGTTHTYTYDVNGRLTADAITTLGTADGTIRRLEFNFDSASRPLQLTSYDAALGGNVKNQVQREYHGLGQLIKEYQEHSGAVNTVTSLKVQSAYSETQLTGSGNHSRSISMTYPNNRVLHYRYSTGVDSNISRISELASASSGGTVFEAYSYLGLSTIVVRAHPQPLVDLTYLKQGAEGNGEAGDQYRGLDRFGRVIDQRWRKSDGTHTDRFLYGHDRNGNRMFRDNAQGDSGAAALDELYHPNDDGQEPPEGYDSLDRLFEFRRGTLNGANNAITNATRTLTWDLDALGNWNSITTDGESTEFRTHNKQNQITSGGLSYDGNGNLTSGGNSYDAWNRLAKHTVGDDTTPYAYDALGRRISIGPTTHSQSAPEQDAVNLYYSDEWQVIHERTEVEGGGGQNSNGQKNEEESFGPLGPLMSIQQTDYVWSEAYVDAMVLRDRDVDLDGSLEERVYVQQDANFNVTALINASGGVVERFIEDPYGTATFLDPNWSVDSGGSDYDWIYLHQGLRYEVKSGTYDNRGRPYDSALGRFWSQDPHPTPYVDGMNVYQYVSSNPLVLLDPTGLREARCAATLIRTGAAAGTVAAADGPVPVLDVVGVGIAVCGCGYAIGELIAPLIIPETKPYLPPLRPPPPKPPTQPPPPGPCEFYLAWCNWGTKEGHDVPGYKWVKSAAACSKCYATCKATGGWPFESCPLGPPKTGPRWPSPVWPD